MRSQVFHQALNVDLRHLLLAPEYGQGWWDSPGMDPLQLPLISNPRFRSITFYDDVYRELGTPRQSRVNRIDHVSFLELPINQGRGGLGIEVIHRSGDARGYLESGAKCHLGWTIRELKVGWGRNTWDQRFTVGGLLGVSLMLGEWQPQHSLELAARPYGTVILQARTGRRPDMRMISWEAKGEQYRSEMQVWHHWWNARGRIDLAKLLLLDVQYGNDRTYAPAKWYEKESFGIDPELVAHTVKTALHFRPMDRTIIALKWQTLSESGSAEAFSKGRSFAKLTNLHLDEVDMDLIGIYRWVDSQYLSLAYGNYKITGTQRGHLEPWPFSATIFDQVLRIYYRGMGEVHVDRITAEYARGIGDGRDWALQAGYIWMIPDFELSERHTKLIIFDTGDIIHSYLNIVHAEFLACKIQKSVTLNRITCSYTFAQTIPVRIRLREAPPSEEPPEEEKEVRGGSFHQLEISYLW